MNVRELQCSGKRRFDTSRAAIKAIRKMRRSDGLRPYLCPCCHWFHIGNNIKHDRRMED